MNLVSQTMQCSSYGDFNIPHFYGSKDAPQYDVNGNHSNVRTYGENPESEGRGPWRATGLEQTNSLAENQSAHSVLHYMPTSSSMTTSSTTQLSTSSSTLAHAQSTAQPTSSSLSYASGFLASTGGGPTSSAFGGSTSSAFGGASWINQISGSSSLGLIQPPIVHASHFVTGSDYGIPSLPTVHWPPGSVANSLPSTIMPTRCQFGQDTVGGFPRWPGMDTTGSVSSSPTWTSSSIELVIPTPTRILSGPDIPLLNKQPPINDQLKLEPPEDIQPEAFVRRLPDIVIPPPPPPPPPPPVIPETQVVRSDTPMSDHNMSSPPPVIKFDKNAHHKRPSYLEMVAKALMSSSDLCLPLAKIYTFVEEHYSHVHTIAVKSWKNSIRHTLSSQPCFLKNQGSVFSLHTWRLHSAYMIDFKNDHFDSGLVKKRAKELQKADMPVRMSLPSASVISTNQDPSCSANLGSGYKFPDVVPSADSLSQVRL